MAKTKNDDTSAIVPPNEVRYRGVRKKSSRSYRAESRIPKYLWLGTFDTPEQAARAYDTVARKYHGPKAKTNFPPTNEDNRENANPMNVSDVNNLNQSSDIGSSSRSSDGLAINQNPLLPCFSAFNKEGSAPPRTALEEYNLEVLRRGGVIPCDPETTNHIQKETFIGRSDNGFEVQDQPSTTNHLEVNLDLTLAPPGTFLK